LLRKASSAHSCLTARIQMEMCDAAQQILAALPARRDRPLYGRSEGRYYMPALTTGAVVWLKEALLCKKHIKSKIGRSNYQT
jgi:hypothetical protein